LGSLSMFGNTEGQYNTAVGSNALRENKAKWSLVAIGAFAMEYANSDTLAGTPGNTAVGANALRGTLPASGNTGVRNTAVGFGSMFVNTSGSGNADRKSTRLNSSHVKISYAVFCLKKKKN